MPIRKYWMFSIPKCPPKTTDLNHQSRECWPRDSERPHEKSEGFMTKMWFCVVAGHIRSSDQRLQTKRYVPMAPFVITAVMIAKRLLTLNWHCILCDCSEFRRVGRHILDLSGSSKSDPDSDGVEYAHMSIGCDQNPLVTRN